MSEKILSQDEIDALLKGVAGGEVHTDPKQAPAPGAIMPFNFGRHDRVVRGRMAALDIIHDRFIKLLTVTFSRAVHRPLAVTIQGIAVVKFETMLDRLPLPSSLIVFKMEPLRGHALLAMDAPLVYLLTDHYFGGMGQTPVKPEGRDFSQIQQRMIRNIATLALSDLEKAWKGAHPVKTEVLRVESNPQFAMIIAASELIVAVTLSLQLNEEVREFHLCYPYSMLEPIKEKLYAGFMSDEFEVDQHWAQRLRAELHHCPLEVSVELGQALIRVEDLLNFVPGDTILLDKSLGVPVVTSIEGIPKFMGMPGVLKGQQALQVVSVIKPGA